jgi:ABC-type transport system involved in multi-copper enzyme maturation permease subunit
VILTQTVAIFVDAYRELNAKKLFWFVLAISLLVVGAFAAVGINDKGITILWWQIDSGVFNATLFPPETFYKLMFTALGVKFWLAWFATILALVSTAGIIPDFIASGSIELSLSKPIRRVRLFITKYLAGLLFAAMQVTVFTLASFLVIGIRGKTWEPGLFWAIPIMLVFFSSVFCICALLGLLTRSTIASLLLTLLAWFGIFGLHTVEQVAMSLRIGNQLRIETLEKNISELERQSENGLLGGGRTTRRDADAPATTSASKPMRAEEAVAAEPASPEPPIERTESPLLARRREQLSSARDNTWNFKLFHGITYSLKAALPKTSETVELLEYTLISAADLQDNDRDNDMQPMFGGGDDVRISIRELTKRIDAEKRSRTATWIIGTSLGFQIVVVGLGAWIFSRRDF